MGYVAIILLLVRNNRRTLHTELFRCILCTGACTDCALHGSKYHWCKLGTRKHDWDYCSIKPGHTYKNEKCRANHECGHNGEKFMWCYKESGGWDYCSRIEETSTVQYTTNGELCQNFCDLGTEK